MRVLFLVDRLEQRGGALYHLLDVLRAVAEVADVRVVAGAGRTERLGARWPAGLPCARVGALAAPAEESSGLEALDEALAWADVVHAQNLMNPAALRRVVATGRAVVTVQDHRVFCPGPGRTLPEGQACGVPFEQADCSRCLKPFEYQRRMEEITRLRRDALRGARLVVLSRYMRRELALAGLPGAVVVPPWVELGPERPPLQGHGYLFAGRLVEHKAPDLAWQAWKQSGVEAPLRVAGAGRLAGALEGAEVLGWLEPEALRAQMRESRALLMPSRWQEPFGIVVLEALAQSLPVLAMDVGGLSEWRGPGVRLVPAGDVGALAKRINQVERDRTWTAAAAHVARRRAEREFRREHLFPRLWAVYAAAMRGAPGLIRSARWSSG